MLESELNAIVDTISSNEKSKLDYWNLQAYIFLLGLPKTAPVPSDIQDIINKTPKINNVFDADKNYIEIYQAIVKYYEDLDLVTDSHRKFAAEFYNPPTAVGITALDILAKLDDKKRSASGPKPDKNSLDYHKRLLEEYTLEVSPHLPNPDGHWAEINSITGDGYNPLFTGRLPYPLEFHAALPNTRQQPMSVGTAVIHNGGSLLSLRNANAVGANVKLHPMFRTKLEHITGEDAPQLAEQLYPPTPENDFEYIYINLQRDRDEWGRFQPQMSSEVFRSRSLRENINKYQQAACLTLPADNSFYHQGFNPKKSSGDNSMSTLEHMLDEIVDSIKNGTNDFKIPDKVLKRLYQKSTEFGYNPSVSPIIYGTPPVDLKNTDNLKILLKGSFAQSVKTITGRGGDDSKVMEQNFDSETRCAVMLQFVKFDFTDQILNDTNPKQFNISCKDAIDRAGIHNLILQINRKIKINETISQRDVEKYLDGLAMAYKHRPMNHHRATFLNYFEKLYNHLPEDKQILFKNSDSDETPWASDWINENVEVKPEISIDISDVETKPVSRYQKFRKNRGWEYTASINRGNSPVVCSGNRAVITRSLDGSELTTPSAKTKAYAEYCATDLGAVLSNQHEEEMTGDSPFPGFTRIHKGGSGGAQVKAGYTDMYTDEHGQQYFIKKTGEKNYTGDDIAEILTARIGRKLLGSDARLIAECEPITAVNGDVYVKSKCSPNWSELHKHKKETMLDKAIDQRVLGKNFEGALRHHKARKSEDIGDPRRDIYNSLDSIQKKQLAKSLAMCLVLMEYDCNTENIGPSDEGIVKIDHGWGLVNILKSKHKKVRLYEFKEPLGNRGGNQRGTPTNHFLDYPDILSGREFIDSIDEFYTEFLSKGETGKVALYEEIKGSIESILVARDSEYNQRETLLYLLRHTDFEPKCFKGQSLDKMFANNMHGIDITTVVEEVATEVAKQIEFRMHSTNIYKHTLDYQSIKEIISASNTENNEIDTFNIVRKSIHGIYKTLERIEDLEGHKINIQDYISEDCGTVLGDMLDDLQRVVDILDQDGPHIDELMDMLPELKYIKERSQQSEKFKDRFTGPILSIVNPIENKVILDEFEGRTRNKRSRDDDEIMLHEDQVSHKKPEFGVVDDYDPIMDRYDTSRGVLPERVQTPPEETPSRGAKARAILPEIHDVKSLKSSIQRSNKYITFQKEESDSHVIVEQVLVRNIKKAKITYNTSGDLSTEIESATTHPANDELKVFANCIQASGCQQPKFDRGNIIDLIEVLEYLKRSQFECAPEITPRMINKADSMQQATLKELCHDLGHISDSIHHPHNSQNLEGAQPKSSR